MIAFDLDGTLVDSRHDLIDSVNVVRHSLDLEPLVFEDSWQNVCRGMPHLYAKCFPVNTYAPEALRATFEQAYAERIYRRTKVYSGVESLLTRLSEIEPLAVVTNKPQRATEMLLKAAGLSDYFQIIVGGDRCEASKPSPIPLEFAYDELNRTGPLMMVGDSNGDVRCGKAADAITVWCTWGYWTEILEVPDVIADTPEAIWKMVNAK